MYGRIIELAESFNDEMLKKLVLAVLDEYKDKIINLPGAFKLHHAIRGGLLMPARPAQNRLYRLRPPASPDGNGLS